ncbi:MAG: pyrroloquinoline quinone-dependent dehydrogenase [Bacteroidota bacterium]
MKVFEIRYLRLTLWIGLHGLLWFSAQSCTEKAVLKKEYTQWESYLGGLERNHYTTLDQITPENLDQLEVVWEYETPDMGQMQMNPIVVDTVLYGVTAALRAIALHAATGEELWQFGDSLQVWHSTSRGVSYWESGDDRRVLFTRGSQLWALDALTGKPISSFGNSGAVDLRSGLPETAKDKFVISNTPGTVFKDLIIMPLRVSESIGAAPGHLMAFNVVTGAVEWVFHTIPSEGHPGFDSWEDPTSLKKGYIGGANNWAGMAVDVDHEILYVPTGSAAPDFYGGLRKGPNLYANCLLALEANTGELLWHFQLTHHDVWDRDPPAPPNLITLKKDGKDIPAVLQTTKQGLVFAFNRLTGVPIYDIEERSVPQSLLEDEQTSPTQPFPTKPKPFARQSNDISSQNISPYAPNPEELLQTLQQAEKAIYTPPALTPVFLLPGYDGGAEWGGAGADPDNGILYVNSNEMPWILQMGRDSLASKDEAPTGASLYQQNCAVCHQANRKGNVQSGYPSLEGLSGKLTKENAKNIIQNGRGMMFGFPHLKGDKLEALISFIYEEEDKMEVTASTDESLPAMPYKHMGYHKFLDGNGLPGIDPPWGTLHAIDMNTGDYLWSTTLGSTPNINGLADAPTGCENYGGPIITQNGLLFIAGTKDGYFRAFDRHTGKELWKYALPAASFATPTTYQINGKQYIALACGGEKLGTPKGNKIIAFAIRP